MSKWIAFRNKIPTLGVAIDVRYLKNGEYVENLDLGRIKRLSDLGNGWVGFDTDLYVAIAVSPEYEWRKSPK